MVRDRGLSFALTQTDETNPPATARLSPPPSPLKGQTTPSTPVLPPRVAGGHPHPPRSEEGQRLLGLRRKRKISSLRVVRKVGVQPLIVALPPSLAGRRPLRQSRRGQRSAVYPRKAGTPLTLEVREVRVLVQPHQTPEPT